MASFYVDGEPPIVKRRSVESYAHKAAKAVVVGWLRAEGEKAGDDHYVSNDILGVHWRVNRPGPCWGIWEEYPVLSDGTGILPVWDEIGDGHEGRPPTFKELVDAATPPAVIFDIAVQHKGQIQYAIEIVHKHDIGAQKAELLARLEDRPHILVLPAQWVLRQIGVPRKFPPKEWWLFEDIPSTYLRPACLRS